jgi:hypothetical protein
MSDAAPENTLATSDPEATGHAVVEEPRLPVPPSQSEASGLQRTDACPLDTMLTSPTTPSESLVDESPPDIPQSKPSFWAGVWIALGLLFIVLCCLVHPLGGLRLPGCIAGILLVLLGAGIALRPYQSDTAPIKSQDEQINKIRYACYELSMEANRSRDQRAGYVVFAASLGPLAVAMLACQLLVYSGKDSKVEAIVLIATELTLLLLALSTGFMHMGSSHKHWIKARLRSEILRREEFLYRLKVGPYQRCKAEQMKQNVDTRIDTIKTEEYPETLIPLEERNGLTWLHQLEDNDQEALPEAAQSLADYTVERLTHQIHYYRRKSEHHERHDAIYENLARGSLELALVAAAFHLGVLASDGHLPEPIHLTVAISALVLPALGAGFLALRTYFENHRLSRSYTHQAAQLNDLRTRLNDLAQEHDALAPDLFSKRLKRLVLLTEMQLSNELRQWWLIVNPDKPTAN